MYREVRIADHSLTAVNTSAPNVSGVKRFFPVFLALVVACGGSTSVTTSSGASQTTDIVNEGAATTTLPQNSSTAAPGSTSTAPDRQIAPDFTLKLGDGGQYTLSDGAKPVYLVFWAEW